MGRPSNFDREAAIEKAMNRIWAEGYEACSVKSLSEMLGITRSSFYNAFGSREELFLEVFDLYLTQLPELHLEKCNEADGAKHVITRLMVSLVEIRFGNDIRPGCLLVNCAVELIGKTETLGQVLNGALCGLAEKLQTVLSDGIEQGELSPDLDVPAVAHGVLAFLLGVNVMSKMSVSRQDALAAGYAFLDRYGLRAEEKTIQ
ncbi:TetR/AcrR family transcriptional regulator [Hirschia litorea]|uniref:TetR/AcrR family transcriptional regulator n=1 Tax=Hirschia litorea TaxID=1199156 RepID=A0ABW2IHH0_9PROT